VTPENSAQEDASAQDFWLRQMNKTNALNQWVFSQFGYALGQKILEVGCGNGNFTAMIGDTGADLLAVDIDETFVRAARTATNHQVRVNVENHDITKSNWNAEFDTIVMLDVLEHLSDDIEILRRLWDALIPGGKLVLKVPALPGIFGAMDEAVGHKRRYTRRTLGSALSGAGFVDTKCWSFNFVGIFGWWLNGHVLHRPVPPAAQLRRFNRLVPLFRAIDLIAPPGVGLSLVAIAERPQFAQHG
jgi:SAM-dependent methyltransferase